MSFNKKTLAGLKSFLAARFAADPEMERVAVFVPTRFLTWITSRPQPGSRVEPGGRLYFDDILGPNLAGYPYVSLLDDPRIGYSEGTLVYGRALATGGRGPNFYMLRQCGKLEGEFGFFPKDDLIQHMLKPIDEHGDDYWDIIHFISDPNRRPHIYCGVINQNGFDFSFSDKNVAFEFKMRFGIG